MYFIYEEEKKMLSKSPSGSRTTVPLIISPRPNTSCKSEEMQIPVFILLKKYV